ncbi:hypothetical protein [Jiulongibacter sp. NS-SX5]|uniref:hypothetical protein n=1 Tax=Jiulongibacter sp. NS-SX5 TaxID=3463854 RepID=UPI004058D392
MFQGRKRRIALILGSVIVLLIVLVAHFAQKRPKVNLSILQYNQLEENHSNLNLQVTLKNPLPLKIRSENFKMKIIANNETLAESFGEVPLELKGLTKNTFKLPVRLYSETVKRQTKHLTPTSTDSTNYHIYLSFIQPSPSFFVPDTLEIEHTLKSPTFRMPEVSFEGMELNHLLSKKKRELLVTINVVNFSNDPIVLLNPSYSLQIDDDPEVLKGRRMGKVKINGSSAQKFTLNIDMDEKKLLRNTPELLFKKSESKINIRLDSKLLINNAILDGCEIHMNIATDFESLINN